MTPPSFLLVHGLSYNSYNTVNASEDVSTSNTLHYMVTHEHPHTVPLGNHTALTLILHCVSLHDSTSLPSPNTDTHTHSQFHPSLPPISLAPPSFLPRSCPLSLYLSFCFFPLTVLPPPCWLVAGGC